VGVGVGVSGGQAHAVASPVGGAGFFGQAGFLARPENENLAEIFGRSGRLNGTDPDAITRIVSSICSTSFGSVPKVASIHGRLAGMATANS
jgi:hypothetical protein